MHLPDTIIEPLCEMYRNLHVQIPFALLLGRQYRILHRQLDQSQWYSQERLRLEQNLKLQRLISHCYENVPYYRRLMDEHSLKPADISTVDDLPKLPFLTKQIARDKVEQLKSRDFDRLRPAQAHSGGTSGDNLFLWRSAYANLAEFAADLRAFSWAGYKDGNRCIVLQRPMRMQYRDGRPRLWYYRYGRKRLQLAANRLDADDLARIIEKIHRYKPRLLYAYPSNLEILAKHCIDNNIKFESIKTLITTSETLYPWHRSLARRAFGCRIYDHYGQAEMVASAAQCPAGKYHFYDENSIVEVLDEDGNQVTDGTGQVVGTSLTNYAQPFIRYRMSDLVTVSPGRCSCGRFLTTCDSIDGRDYSLLMRPDGTRLSAQALRLLLNKPLDTGKLGQLQIRQLQPDYVEVHFVRDESFCQDTMNELLSILRAELTAQVQVVPRFVPAIAKTNAGKHQLFVIECRRPGT